MHIKVQNPSFLNAEKIKILPIDSLSQSQVSGSKKKIFSSASKKKYAKPIISFLNFFKDKHLHSSKTQKQENPHNLLTHKKEEMFQFHQFQEQSNNISEIGSQYGEKNYDHELKQVLKKNKKAQRKQYETPKVMLRAQTQQKQNFQTTKYQRFQKFQTQMQRTTHNAKQSQSNFTAYDLSEKGNKKLNNFHSQTPKFQKRIKTDFNGKKQDIGIEKIDSKQKFIPQYQCSTFKPFKIDTTTSFQPLNFQKTSKPLNPSHRRSRTQQDLNSPDRHKAEEIFQNYHKLKKIHHKSPKHRQQFYHQLLKQKASSTTELSHLQNKNVQNSKKSQPEVKQYFRSLPKYEPMVMLQNALNIDASTARLVMTPKSFSKGKIDEQTLTRIIKQRQKDFFQKNIGKPFEQSSYTFDQIKNKLAKIQSGQQNKHNKSQTNVGVKKNALLYSDFYGKGNAEKQKQDLKDKKKVIKFKGISFKANLIRKHTDIYEKHMKKMMIDKNLSVRVTPKVSQIIS